MLAIQQVSNGMTRIHFGFTMPYGALDTVRRPTFVEDLNHALDLVAGHFDSAWSIDHLQLDANDLLEGFTTLTYMAACHPQLMFGHVVLCQSFRNPALLAQMESDPAFSERRAVHPWHRRGLGSGRIPGLRL